MWPRPRPLIIGTRTPAAATIETRGIDTLSPTPPVECLSILAPTISPRSSTSPECSIASVHTASSSGFKPEKKIAIVIAAIW